ncbi:hypothetical protein [Nonomuraea turcica]|uniref:hypothetical protein n=1 Tax=Nonomuraea sp. G32 TaxID=3067274 RepID=UPI00273AEBB9|nr:hypothetical protein [Nonomuraea sp. G32]MDP4500996.1 hypothetical protein [Nonomuraea sp. G32]
MIEIANNVDDQQHIDDLQRAADAIHDQAAAARNLPEEAFHDPIFMRRRFEKIVAELDAAELIIAREIELRAADAPTAPPEVRDAMACHGGHIQPVDVTIDGRQLTLAIPACGVTDPAEADKRWRALLKRYKGQQS